MPARNGPVHAGSISGRERQSSAGATRRSPTSSSSTCGGGSTRTCMARHSATRTAVLSGSADSFAVHFAERVADQFEARPVGVVEVHRRLVDDRVRNTFALEVVLQTLPPFRLH